jgi:hypothetical protein
LKEKAMRKPIFIYLMTLAISISLFVRAEATILDFQDNVASPPGFYGYVYYENYTAGRFTDHTGKKAYDLDQSLNVWTLKPSYYSKLWDRTFSIGSYIPFGIVSARNAFGEKERSNGLGDVIVAPGVFLYENNATGTFLSFWENVSMPTGSWSETRALLGGPNLGTHYWFLQHQLAFAQLFDKGKYSLDMNLSYYQKFKEPDLDVRVGNSLEVEAIAGYGITPNFRAGIYADYWTDVENTKINGTSIDDSKRKFFSIGPSLMYGTEKWAFNLRLVSDVMSENGPKGFQTWLRFLYSF